MATACKASNAPNPNEHAHAAQSSSGSRNARNVGSTARGSGANMQSQRSSIFVHEQRTDSAGVVDGEVRDDTDGMSDEVSNVRSVVQCNSCQCQNNFNQNILSVDNNNAVINRSIKTVKIGDISVKCLVDTGSDVNLISHDLFSMFSDVNNYVPERIALTGLGTSQVTSIGKFTYKLTVDGHCYFVYFYVVPKGVIPYPIILGQTFLVNTVTLIDKGIVQIKPHSYDSSFLQCLLTSNNNSELSPHVQRIIDSYAPLKIKEAPIKLKIVLKDDIPVVQRPRRFALKEEEEVRQKIDEWLSHGIIRPSFSEYASPLVLVRKKDGSIRVCVD